MSKIYVFDIDGTICTNTNGDYEAATPYQEIVDKINELYESGNTIKMMTARGSTTGIDWTVLTERQLSEWGINYHELIMNKKPHADVFVDDKAINVSSFRLL
jgi:hypothetical protein|tara:strand:+ start:1219 stop:1524 length:306 start_codon:yes stop_codon:yes gene_type:complete